jgi:hypothetical protein
LAIVFVGIMVVFEGIEHYLDSRLDELRERPRRLSTRQFRRLVSQLERMPRQPLGLCFQKGREPESFARHIHEAFKQANWDVQFTELDLRDSELEAGILFVSEGINQPPLSPDFSHLERAFKAADIPFKHRRLAVRGPYTGGVSTADAVILVGPRHQY